jgi:hypothetical protein
MSYTEYLRRKEAAAPKIVNTVKPTDSSMHTQKVKQMASSVLYQREGQFKGSMLQTNDRSGNQHALVVHDSPMGKNGDAAAFLQYLGSQAIRNDAAASRGKITLNADADCFGCVPTLGPAPLSGSDWIRREQGIVQSCVPTPHTQAGDKVDGPKFVDNTIRLSSGWAYTTTNRCCGNPVANHSIKDVPPIPDYEASRNGVKTSVLPHQNGGDLPYKAGAALRKIPYVEKHHGNDLNVNPKRPFKKYQGGLARILKLNDPRMYPVKP